MKREIKAENGAALKGAALCGTKRSKVCSVGVNDADYGIERCPYYARWKGLLVRCYSARELARNPAYIGCSVCDEWLLFSNFKQWMEKQDWEGKQIDKDLLIPGNKVYSPEACVFVDARINSLMTDRRGDRGEWPIGVYFDKGRGKFRARCRDGSKRMVHLGFYSTPEGAHAAYVKFKSDLIESLSDEYKEIKKPLMIHAKLLRESIGVE